MNMSNYDWVYNPANPMYQSMHNIPTDGPWIPWVIIALICLFIVWYLGKG